MSEIRRCKNCGARGHSELSCSYQKDAYRQDNFMTGQEWFTAFDKAFRGKAFAYDTKEGERVIAAVTKAAYEAAKKASGLE